MISDSLKFRIKAFVTHLLLSLVVAIISLCVVFFIWHPAPLAKAVGVTHIFLMMLAIDAILGPLLTFTIAKPNKKSLKFDLMVIVLLQISAYVYGMYHISVNRPVYIAFDTLSFELVQASDVPAFSLQKASTEYQKLAYGRPKWVAVRPYKDAEEQQQRIFNEIGNGVTPSMQPDLYEPLQNQWQTIENQSQSLAQLKQYNAINDVNHVLTKYHNADAFLPLKAYKQSMVVLIDKQQHQIVDIVDLRPYHENQ